jgi:hypothetical protein
MSILFMYYNNLFSALKYKYIIEQKVLITMPIISSKAIKTEFF